MARRLEHGSTGRTKLALSMSSGPTAVRQGHFRVLQPGGLPGPMSADYRHVVAERAVTVAVADGSVAGSRCGGDEGRPSAGVDVGSGAL